MKCEHYHKPKHIKVNEILYSCENVWAFANTEKSYKGENIFYSAMWYHVYKVLKHIK